MTDLMAGFSPGKTRRNGWSTTWLMGLILLASACQNTATDDRLREEGLLNRLGGDYFSTWVRFYPVEASIRGYHEYDGELGDYSREELQKRLAWLRNFRQRLLGVDATKLPSTSYLDWLLLTSAVKGEIHELAEPNNWTRSPLFYGDTICDGLRALLANESLSTSQTQALISQLGRIPSFLDDARENIEAPPRLLVEEGVDALKRCQGIVEGLPASLEGSLSPQALAAIGQSGRVAARALRESVTYLETKVLPNASGPFGLGSERLARLLRYGEMEDTSLEDIRQNAMRAIRETQEKMKDIAARMETSPSLANVLAMATNDHLPETELLPQVKGFLDEVMAFVSEHRLVSHFDASPISIIATPDHLRGGDLVAVGSSGPLDPNPKPSFFMLTLPLSSWSRDRVENHLRALPTRSLRLAVIREIYPGKHLHDSLLADSKSRIRKLLASKAHREGWGLYVEQLLIDHGYAWEDALLRLLQLHRGLVAQGRLVVAIDLHSGTMNLSDATRFFSEEVYLGAGESRQEARSAAVDPERWSAALGKLKILELHERYVEHTGEAGTLGDFHDKLLTHAGLPLTLVNIER